MVVIISSQGGAFKFMPSTEEVPVFTGTQKTNETGFPLTVCQFVTRLGHN